MKKEEDSGGGDPGDNEISSGVRPPTHSLSLHALLSLPTRICNPAPAASSVRSCKVTPLIKITLDDVLNKRHLPPLTLKDFEEWLVYVEGNPRYLYFILWLKEYESRYAAWLAESGCALPVGSSPNFPSTTTLGSDPDPDSCSPPNRDLSYINLIPSSAPLALFFTRAKQTFLDPACDSPYTLGHAAFLAFTPSTHALSLSIPQFTMAENHSGTGVGFLPTSLASHPHPHPTELAPLASYARKALKESLRCFAETACHNVGTRRAWCGVAGGTFLILVLGILPALSTYFFAPSRWWRVVGWFGCWLGGTILISSLHGICMLIYIFGDLRQLRSFELARPSISEPRAIARASPKLKHFFTRDGEEDEIVTGNPDTGTGIRTGTQTGDSTASAPSSFQPSPAIETAAMQGAKKPMQKRPWSAESASETSTGTPVVCLGPGAFNIGLGTAITESSVSARVGTAPPEDVSKAECGLDDEDDFGIEISPAYYYSEPAVSGDGGKPARRESMRSAGSGSKIGLVIRWVIGKRGSVGASTGPGEKILGQLNDNVAQGQGQTRSHAGTFGIRSWRGGLGSLPDQSCDVCRVDLEKGLDVIQTERLVDDYQFPDADIASKFEDIRTAEFITHDHSELKPQLDAIPSPVTSSDSPSMVCGTRTTVAKKHVSSPVSSAVFDFDKLPAAAAVRRLSTPCTFASTPDFSSPASSHVLTPPQSLPLPPPPSVLYAHPGARLITPSLVTPSPGLSLEGMGAKSRPTRERQWWDTCPRHPAVEATLAIRTHNLPPSLSVPRSFGPTSPAYPATPASSGVQSRVHVDDTTLGASASSSSYDAPSDLTCKAKMRLRRVMGVPMLSPFTRVLEPLVSRGQWEIVIRSTIIAALSAWLVIGGLIALPEIR